MKLKIVSKEIKDTEMGVNNKTDSQHKGDSVVNTSASTSLATTDDIQSNQVLTEEISISKEVVIVKQEDSKVLTTDVLGFQNTDSKSEDCVVTSTSESNSSKDQEHKVPSEMHPYDAFSLATTELEEVLKPEDSEVCMADASSVQNSDNASASTSQLNSNENRLTKISSEDSLSATEESQSTVNIKDSKSHRQNIHYSSESSDYETDESSDSSDCEQFFDNLRKSAGPTKLPVLKTKGELTTADLPPVEDLHITVNSTELLKIGYILHSVVAEERNEFLVIVESDGNSNPLDEDSVLFLSSDKPLGKIHDVFGNVRKPNYVVRFNKAEDIFDKGVTAGQIVYYSPANGELTRYVLVDVLKKQKGSDASWKDNNEPPEDEIDYSDDEQEKLAKQKRRAKTRGKERNWNDKEGEDTSPNKMERRDADHSQKRVFKRPSRNMFQSRTSVPPRSSPRPYSPQSFGSPPSENFGSSGQLRNTVSPQPFGPTPSNSLPFRPFQQRNGQSPQPFGPFSNNMPSPRPYGPLPNRNTPSPQPLGPFLHNNVSSSQQFRQLPYSNAPSSQPFPPSSVSSYQHFTVPPTSYALASPNLVLSHATGAPQLNHSSYMTAPQNNVPLQQSFDKFGSSGLPRNAVSPQPFGPTSSNSIPYRSFLQRNGPSSQPLGPFLQRNGPSSQPLGPFPQSNMPSPQSFGQFPQNNMPSPQPFGQFPQSNMPSPQPFPHGNVPSPQSFEPLPHHRNVPSPQLIGPLPHSSVPSLQPFGSFQHNNIPSQQRFGQLPYSTVPSQALGTFPQSSVSSHQPFTVPPTSYTLASSSPALSYAIGASQVNPSSLMSAPQNNIPLQQQLLLQSYQPIGSFLSRPPPN